MRRAKIKPSINLAASRRTIPAAISTATAAKSPAKTLPSAKTLAPAKPLSPARTVPSVGRTRSSSLSAGVTSGEEQPRKPPVTPQATVGSNGNGCETTTVVKTQAKQAVIETIDSTETSVTVKPSDIKSSAKVTSDPAPSPVINKEAGKNPENVAIRIPRGRRKHAPTIPSRSKPRQRPVACERTKSATVRATEVNEPNINDKSKVKGDDGGGNPVTVQAAPKTTVKEPPPVWRVVGDDGPISVAISKTAGKPTISTPTSVVPQAQAEADNTSDVQDFQIHQDESVQRKASATTKTTVSKSAPLRSIGQAEKKNPMNIYERKLRELKETLEEETPAKRRRRYVKKMPSDRSNMIMSDLIYYNPKHNPMKQTEIRDRSPLHKNSNEIITKLPDEDEDDEGQDVDEFAPQVKIGPDGSLIVDQKSLVKDASPQKTFEIADSDIIHEDFSRTTYASFRKRTRTTNWTKKETEKFYMALSAVGTDFSMITAMFPKRTRTQIKNKFKREERHNFLKVDNAIKKISKVSMSMFTQSDEDSESETENRPTRVKPKKSAGKKRHLSEGTANAQNKDETEPAALATANTSTGSTTMQQLDNEEQLSAGEDIEIPTENLQETRLDDTTQSEDSEEDICMETILSRPTRSGRQPKMRTNFTIEVSQPKAHVKANSTVRQTEKLAKCMASYSQHALQEHLDKEPESILVNRTQGTPVNGATTRTNDIGSTPSISVSPNVHGVALPSGSIGSTQSDRIVTMPSNYTASPSNLQGATPGNHHNESSPKTSANVRTPSNPLGNIQHIVINQPVLQQATTPSPIKTHIYVINSPDGSQSIVQVPLTTAVHSPVRQTGSSPIVIHRVQANQPVSLNVQNIMLTPSSLQNRTPPQRFVLNPHKITAVSPTKSVLLRSLTSPPVKSPGNRLLVPSPKDQRRPLAQHGNAAVSLKQRTLQVVTSQQNHSGQLPLPAADCALLQRNRKTACGEQQLADPVVAQQVDVESYDHLSDSGTSESGPFIPPVSAVSKASTHYSGMEQTSDQLMISGLGSDGLSTRDIFEQISYEQGVAAAWNGSVAANMEVAISEEIISQIATEIATEK